MKLIGKIKDRLRPKLSRGFAMWVASSLVSRGIGIVCQLVQVPLVVKAYGAEAFGLWMAMTSFAQLVLFADFGLGTGVQNRVAEAFARKDHDDARVVFSSAFIFLAGIGLVLGLLLSGVAMRLDYATQFKLSDAATIAQAPGATYAVIWTFCAGFPFGLAQRLAFGLQEGWKFNAAQAIGSIVSVVAVALAAQAQWSLAALVVASRGAMLAGNVVLVAVQLVQLRWLALRPVLPFSFPAISGLLKLGAYFSVQQILNTVLFAAPQLIISTTLGAAAVTPFNLVQRLFNLFAVIQNAFMLPLWPAYSKAKANGEFHWMRQTLRRSLKAVAVFSVMPMLVGCVFAGPLIALWVGADAPPIEPALIWLLFAWNTIIFFQQPFGYLLAGVSEVKRTTLYCVLTAITSTALMLLLAHPFGAPGVVLGLLLGYLPFNLVGNILETNRYLRTCLTAPSPA